MIEEHQKLFHSLAMRCMFLCKRGRPDFAPGISFLTIRVKKPCKEDWRRLKKIMNFLKNTNADMLTLKVGDEQIIHWYVDALFGVHEDLKSNIVACMTLGQGMISNHSTKQKNNSRSLTEAVIIGVDDKLSKIIWTKRFTEQQGFEVITNIFYQDYQSNIR